MKILKLTSLLILPFLARAQKNEFPEAWLGNWKGELQWFRTGNPIPQKVSMELRIQPGDSADTYTWQIIYGGPSEDNRPYRLIPKDRERGHWIIDERNGIRLDQFWVGNQFGGAFTVLGNTIINSYRLSGEEIQVEFFSMPATALSHSGEGTDESPEVDSYRIGGYQKAVLTKQN